MATTRHGPAPQPLDPPDPLAVPITRRRALLLLGAAGSVAATGGLGFVLAGCGQSLPDHPVWVPIGVGPADLPVAEPVEVPLTATWDGGSLDISTWLVRNEDGSLTAYNPLCTHANCEYDWVDDTDRFECACHDASFAIDGAVLDGPPPRPLDRWAVRRQDGVVEVEVTGRVQPSPQAAAAEG